MNFANDGHIEIGELFESVRLRTDLDSDARAHVEHCAICRDRFGWMQTATELGTSEAQYEPPKALLDNVLQFGQPQLLKKIRNFIVASLTFDSLTSPTPAGVRRTESTSREMTYRAEDLEIAVSIRRSANGKVVLAGQVLRQDSSPIEDNSARADLVLDGDHVGNTVLSTWGEFMFPEMPAARYGLQIQVAGRTITIPAL